MVLQSVTSKIDITGRKNKVPNTTIDLREYKLKMVLPIADYERIGSIVWARKVFDNIYELSFLLEDGGYTLWFARAKQEGGFELISCSLYDSVETMAIKWKEQDLLSQDDPQKSP